MENRDEIHKYSEQNKAINFKNNKLRHNEWTNTLKYISWNMINQLHLLKNDKWYRNKK